MGDFKVGDRVRIKSWDRMAEEYTEEKYGNGIQLPVSRFDIAMKPLCGLTATIKDIDNEYVKLEDWSNGEESYWTFTTYMLEKVTTLSFDFKIDDKDWEEICSTIGIKPVVSYIDDAADAVRYCINDIQTIQTINKYIKNEEENEMRNEVLELWYKRENEKIKEKYKEIIDKNVEEQYSVVKSYKELIEDFNNRLEELYKYDNTNEQFALKENNGTTVFKYVIDYDKLKDRAREEVGKDAHKELDDLNDKYEEIKALLSMSEDLEYQQSVLIEYGIIDKKTKRMI